MIYKYYCVNCGMQMNGEEIRFDLSELVGMRDAFNVNTPANPASLVSPSVLEANAEMDGGRRLEHGKLCPITISLRTYLAILGNYSGKTSEMLHFGHSDADLKEAVSLFLKTDENTETSDYMIDEYVARIKTLFVADKSHEGSEDNGDYYRTFYVRPEYFDEGRSRYMYSLEYAHDADPESIMKIRAPRPIRGYCPKCGKPVLLNAGKVPHVSVGLLGAQGAGKTTMILSMLQEIEQNFCDLGIKYPGDILCDSRFSVMKGYQSSFRHGWAVPATVETGESLHSVSLLAEDSRSNSKRLLTFVDIAGENCYDPMTKTVNWAAVEKFPMYNNCDLYLLCAGPDSGQEGRAAETPQAILKIADFIYGNLKESRKQAHKTPPLCIVMTKADVMRDAKEQKEEHDPFDNIEVDNKYLYKEQLDELSMAYRTFGEKGIRELLEWLFRAYTQMEDKTYLSMMACSATGREADAWCGDDEIPMNEKGAFRPTGIRELVQWIFRCAGVSPVIGEYRFPGVPSRDEVYLRASSNEEKYRADHYTDKGALERCGSIPCVFMNPTSTDHRVIGSLLEKKKPGLLFRKKTDPILEALQQEGALMDN